MKLTEIHLNDGSHGLPKNPRLIRDAKFAKLCASIRDNPEFMPARPIIVDEAGTVLGGNMRLRACQSLGMTDVPDDWVQRVAGWSVEKKRRFIIMDNRGFGEDDFDLLANEWDMEELQAAGFDEKELTGSFEEKTPESEKQKETPTLEDMAEDNPKLAKFIAAREASRARGADKGEVNFWVCLVFQSWEQKQEFLKQVPDVPTRYGMYADGEAFAAACGKPVMPNTQKPVKVPLDAKLERMAT
jgi:hypothetical protein